MKIFVNDKPLELISFAKLDPTKRFEHRYQNVDEIPEDVEWEGDVIFYEPNSVFAIIKKMIDKNYTVSGVRDGGVIAHRSHNPNVINTFFSVLNLKTICANCQRIMQKQGVKWKQGDLLPDF